MNKIRHHSFLLPGGFCCLELSVACRPCCTFYSDLSHSCYLQMLQNRCFCICANKGCPKKARQVNIDMAAVRVGSVCLTPDRWVRLHHHCVGGCVFYVRPLRMSFLKHHISGFPWLKYHLLHASIHYFTHFPVSSGAQLAPISSSYRAKRKKYTDSASQDSYLKQLK